jgi:hypothetical protein
MSVQAIKRHHSARQMLSVQRGNPEHAASNQEQDDDF